jgi:hypothetical protein
LQVLYPLNEYNESVISAVLAAISGGQVYRTIIQDEPPFAIILYQMLIDKNSLVPDIVGNLTEFVNGNGFEYLYGISIFKYTCLPPCSLLISLFDIIKMLPPSQVFFTVCSHPLLLQLLSNGYYLASPITECTNITDPGVYQLSNNITTPTTTSACITISASNVTLLGVGFAISVGPMSTFPP